jgi:hypothetical protein
VKVDGGMSLWFYKQRTEVAVMILSSTSTMRSFRVIMSVLIEEKQSRPSETQKKRSRHYGLHFVI